MRRPFTCWKYGFAPPACAGRPTRRLTPLFTSQSLGSAYFKRANSSAKISYSHSLLKPINYRLDSLISYLNRSPLPSSFPLCLLIGLLCLGGSSRVAHPPPDLPPLPSLSGASPSPAACTSFLQRPSAVFADLPSSASSIFFSPPAPDPTFENRPIVRSCPRRSGSDLLCRHRRHPPRGHHCIQQPPRSTIELTHLCLGRSHTNASPQMIAVIAVLNRSAHSGAIFTPASCSTSAGSDSDPS